MGKSLLCLLLILPLVQAPETGRSQPAAAPYPRPDKQYYLLERGDVRTLPAGPRYRSSDERVATVEGRTLTAVGEGDCTVWRAGDGERAEAARVSVGWPVQNPVLPYAWQVYVPDSEVHHFGGRLYVYGSLDIASGRYCSPYYLSLMTPDLRRWESHGYSFSSFDPGVPFHGKYLWDPDGVLYDGRYYLYGFFEWDPERENHMFVLEGDDPMGPFRDFRWIVGDRSGEKIDGISAEVFVDDDGSRYIVYAPTRQPVEENYPVIARLQDDHTIVESSRVNLGPWVRDFYEGPSLRKRGDTYYFVYAENCGPITPENRVPTRLSYATSRTVFGPYTYRGIILTLEGLEGNTNIQGSIEPLDGQWYVFYHRALNGHPLKRALCVERIEFDDQELIRPVVPTSSGVAGGLDTSKPLWFNTAVTGHGYKPSERGLYGGVVVDGSAGIGFRYVALTGKERKLVLQGEDLDRITSVTVTADGRTVGRGTGAEISLSGIVPGRAEWVIAVTSSGEILLETARFITE